MADSYRRVVKFALTYFYRNKGMSLAAIFVLTLTTLLVTGLFLLHGASNYLIQEIQSKIDITAYFNQDTPEDTILSVKDELLKDSINIKSVEYVSEDDALSDFLQKHKDNDVFSKAIEELGDNPFLPSLNIITNGDSTQYEKVANILQSPQFSSLINKVDFSEKKATIEKVFSVTKSLNEFGLAIGAILIFIAVCVVFNTIRLIIDSSKEEISTMKIVGASDWFIKAPFVVEGAIFGIIAFIICLSLTLLIVFSLTHFVSILMPGFSLFGYFVANFLLIALIQIVVGAGLGIVSSLIVVRKYLKV